MCWTEIAKNNAGDDAPGERSGIDPGGMGICRKPFRMSPDGRNVVEKISAKYSSRQGQTRIRFHGGNVRVAPGTGVPGTGFNGGIVMGMRLWLWSVVGIGMSGFLTGPAHGGLLNQWGF